MSKIITARFEHACFDDAAAGSNLAAVPPSYPATLDQYTSTTIGNTAAGYGVINLSSTGAAQATALPATAGGLLVCPTTNTTAVSVTLTAALVPGGASTTMALICGPGQTITLPNAWASSALTVSACTPTGTATTAAFAAQLLWSF